MFGEADRFLRAFAPRPLATIGAALAAVGAAFTSFFGDETAAKSGKTN